MGMWIGRNRKARVTYGFDEIALVPGNVTINPNEVDITWRLARREAEPIEFKIPILASAMDGVVDVKFAIAMGKLGGLAVLNLERGFHHRGGPRSALRLRHAAILAWSPAGYTEHRDRPRVQSGVTLRMESATVCSCSRAFCTATALLGLVFDARHGLLLSAPIYLLVPAGWILLARRSRATANELLLLAAVYLLLVANPVTNIHGWRGGWFLHTCNKAG